MADEAEEKDGSEETGRSFLQRNADKIILILITAALSVSGTIAASKYSGRLRVFEYYALSTSGIIQKPQLQGKAVKILVDEKSIENLSTISVAVFNRTDQDFEDVELDLLFSDVGGKPPVVIHSVMKVPNETFDFLPSPTTRAVGLSAGYKIRVANRSESPIFAADYTFEGPEAPKISVMLVKKGVGITEFQLVGKPSNNISSTVLVLGIVFSFLWGMFASYVVDFLLFRLLGRWFKHPLANATIKKPCFGGYEYTHYNYSDRSCWPINNRSRFNVSRQVSNANVNALRSNKLSDEVSATHVRIRQIHERSGARRVGSGESGT